MTKADTTFDLKEFLDYERSRIEVALSEAVDRIGARLPRLLAPVVRLGVLAKGKRIRPILCVAAHRACGGGEHDALYDLSASLELIHAYSLMHDDLPSMDDAALRRGEPTPHTLYGVTATTIAAAALIPGAALQAWEASNALGCSEEQCRAIVRELCAAAGGGGLVGGQALDLLGEERTLDSRELTAIHQRKTGALLTASLSIGARSAGAGEQVRAGLLAYGRGVGLAFQIADDILDATATARNLGKNPSDQDLGKSTYVSLHGLEGARARAQAQVSGALAALAGLEAAGVTAPALEALARYIVERDR